VKAQSLVSPYLETSEAREDSLFLATEAAASRLGLLNWHIHRTMNDGVVIEINQYMGNAAWSGGAGDFKLDPDEVAVHISSPTDAVPLTHRALSAAAKSFVATYDLAINMTTILTAPLHDIHGILILTAVFYSGGHVVLPGSSRDTSTFWDLASTHDVTWFSASPDDVLDIYEARAALIKPTPSYQHLTFVRSSGGRMAPDIVSKIQDLFDAPVLESYGVPETAGFASSNRQGEAKLGTFGRSVDGASIAIFDTETRAVLPAGSDRKGDIAVTGDQVAMGYLNSSDATEMSMYETEDPVTGVRETWFATGDRGTIDEDGFLTVLGDSRNLRAAERAAMEEKIRFARELSSAEEEKRKGEALAAATRSAALERVGVSDADGIDDATADAILARLVTIEANQARLTQDLADKNAAELEELRARLEEAEEAADRAAAADMQMGVASSMGPAVLDMRMDELEAAVMAAAASAENSARNTRQAAAAAKELASSAYGSNQSRAVAIVANTGDQGALTRTVRVALDDVEAAMRSHPAVEYARAFGRKDKRYGAEVFCAIVPKKGARVSEPWLKLHAQSVLPAPMVPKKFYYLDELPLSMSRRELSESPILKDLSEFKGFTEIKGSNIKGPAWPQKGGRAPRPM
jgi:acyl-CoA synthetase (AMP-forming)/AMP-acid ligase II